MLGFTDSDSEDSSKQQASGLNNNGKEETSMPISDEQFKALSDKVDALTANAENIAKDMAANVEKAIAPLTEALTQLQANAKQAEEAERTDLVAKVVANKLLDEETAKAWQLTHCASWLQNACRCCCSDCCRWIPAQ